MRPHTLPLLFLAAASLAACGEDTGSTTGSTGTQSTGGSGGKGGDTATGGAGGTGGAAVDCDNLPAGPLEPTPVLTNVFYGSNDFAFDGKGHIAGKAGTEVVLSDASAQVTVLATGVEEADGLRYRPDGYLVIAIPNADAVLQVSPDGMVSTWVSAVSTPSGLYPDFDGNVWLTRFVGDGVDRIDPDGTIHFIANGPLASLAKGIVFDASRKMLYFTNYSEGRIRRVDMNPGADQTPIEVVLVQGASLDGLVMDACGNIYAVDQGSSDIYRVKLDAAGDAAGPAEKLASFPENVAHAQFGSGPGFDPELLYVAGHPGVVYSIPVGVLGAPVPTPP